jgi:predicted nucleic acid-binding protein
LVKPIYAESSFLVSLIMPDGNTEQAVRLTESLDRPLAFNLLLKLEVTNAIRLRVAAGDIDDTKATECEGKITDLLDRGMWKTTEPVWENVMWRAIGFSRAHTSSKRTRSFDVLHVAAAIETGATIFWSFDKRQRALAEEVGLRVNP